MLTRATKTLERVPLASDAWLQLLRINLDGFSAPSMLLLRKPVGHDVNRQGYRLKTSEGKPSIGKDVPVPNRESK